MGDGRGEIAKISPNGFNALPGFFNGQRFVIIGGAFDASILWNLAEQRKMDMPSLGDEVMDRIATRKTMEL